MIAEAEIERIKQNHGCARNQRTTQFCHEAEDLRAKIKLLEKERDEHEAACIELYKLSLRLEAVINERSAS